MINLLSDFAHWLLSFFASHDICRSSIISNHHLIQNCKNHYSIYPLPIFLMGQLPSGKSQVALEYCAYLPVEIIQCGFWPRFIGIWDYGTAKPDSFAFSITPHF